MIPEHGPAVPLDDRSRAETAVSRVQSRARRARAVRVAAYAAAVGLWAGAAALVATGVSPAWAVVCGVSALLVTVALSLARAAEQRLVMVSVSGRSMEPAYHDGDIVRVRRRAPAARGTVVVVERPPYRAPWPEPSVPRTASAHAIYARHWFIKRVAAVPGDPVPRAQVPALAETPGTTVPEGMLVLLGDNADESYDSRSVGYFPLSRVLGAIVEPDPPAGFTARTRNT